MSEQEKMDAINDTANIIYGIENAVRTEITERKKRSEEWMKNHLEWKEKYFVSHETA